MGIFDFLKPTDINVIIEEFYKDEKAVLLDVRTPSEYKSGHIDKSINVEVDKLTDIGNYIDDKNTKIYVYCLSGGRSDYAIKVLNKMGYSDVINLGGINRYKGKVVK